MLGLVTTKSGELESQDELLRRIDEAAEYVPLERPRAEPAVRLRLDAGQSAVGDEQRRKLELVVDTAHKVWG